jgi:hypothetical protein
MTTENEYEGYEKVTVHLNGAGVGAESFWVRDISGGDDGTRTGVVDNILVWAPFRHGDTVRFVDDDHGRLPYVTEVVSRGPAMWVGVSLGAADPEWIEMPVPKLKMSDTLRDASKALRKSGLPASTLQDFSLVVGFPLEESDRGRPAEDVAEDFLDMSVSKHFDPFFEMADEAGIDVNIHYAVLSAPTDPVGDCGGTIEANPEPPEVVETLSVDDAMRVVASAVDNPGDWEEMLNTAFNDGELPRHLDNEEGRAEILQRLVSGIMHDPRVRATIEAGRQSDALLVAGRFAASSRGLPLPRLERALLVT